MSNRVTFQATEFINRPSGSVTYGFRAFDDHGQVYVNIWDSIPDDDLEVLEMIVESSDEMVVDLLDYLKENQKGCYVGDNWYEWDEIQSIVDV